MCAKNWKQIPAILMFEFPARRHFGSYYVIRLPQLLSNNGPGLGGGGGGELLPIYSLK